MRPRGEAGMCPRHPRERGRAEQAGPVALVRLALACLLLAGCDIPKAVNPVAIYREVTGLADQDRPPLPGLDQPFPNLASVPPRPEPPPAAVRESISAALASDRAESREPLALRTVPGPVVRGGAASPGEPPVPAAPPPRPSLAAAPRVPWTEPPRPQRRSAEPAASRPGQDRSGPVGSNQDMAPPLPPVPGAAPAPPPAELLAPAPGEVPPQPAPDLLAPPRAR